MILIDKYAGYCWGVVKTIEKVEQTLLSNSNKNVCVLGEIIHNPHEIKRLNQKKLNTIDYQDLNFISNDNSIVVIRAHGEPPSTYKLIQNNNISLVDATCPLVKRLQNKILNYYKDNWQIIIFGKINHAEVIGLRGCCNDNCIVAMDADIVSKKINFQKKTIVFSQTTMNVNNYNLFFEQLFYFFKKNNFNIQNDFLKDIIKKESTVCKFMINREEKLKEFAKNNNLILFVAGNHSSNGKVLFDICKKINLNTIFIEDVNDINNEKEYMISKIKNFNSVGITGATSTPMWYLEKVKSVLEKNLNN